METKRYGLFSLYTKIGSEHRYVGKTFAGRRVFYRIPVGYEIEPFTRDGRREIIDRIYDGTFDVVIPDFRMVADFGRYLVMAKGYEERAFNADAF